MTTDRAIARWRLHAQHLTDPLDDAEQVVRSLLAVQAENPGQSAWAVAARTTAPRQDDLAAALADGRILRTHVLRPTWHYVHAEDARWLLDVTAPRILPLLRRQLERVEDRLDELDDRVAEALADAAAHPTRAEVGEALIARGLTLDGHELMILLARLELLGVVCSGAPRQVDETPGRAPEHTYALLADRAPQSRSLERDEALAELALRYLAGHGPATERDLAYWATLTLTDVRRGLAAAADRLDSFEHEGRTYWHAPGGPPATPAPDGHLLQVLDEMYRGYQDTRWALDAEGVVPRQRETAIGMALVDGQLVAAMKRGVDPTRVTFTLAPHRPLTEPELAAIRAAAGRYAQFLGLDAEVVTG
ncbi:winged helix DNA-binding domain-containing protein [Nocardioides sambongensis]|uniref:winged helix DNA-binding domain-containing protein n=1 Tax=Nocardioides sambongensis TaxID=2589074 RepID=UPI0015E8755F|nr:winged helix DNA-binding domain-containing protein [Nocardioides sambongensis]